MAPFRAANGQHLLCGPAQKIPAERTYCCAFFPARASRSWWQCHLAGDAIGSLGVIAAGVIIITTGWPYADPLFSVLLGVLILASAWTVLRDSVLVLLEASPRVINADTVGQQLAAHPSVVSVHDLHVWEITSGFPALTAHVLVHPGDDCHNIRHELEQLLHDRFNVDNTTLQVDHAADTHLVQIQSTAPRRTHPDPGQGTTPTEGERFGADSH